MQRKLCSNCDFISKATIMIVKLQRMENDNKEEFWLKFRPERYGQCKSLSEKYASRFHFFQIEVMACPYWKNEQLEEDWRIANKEW